MTQRHFLIVHAAGSKQKRFLHVQVDDQTALGPWILTLAARLGYPLVDHFGTPIPYQLRSLTDNYTLPTTGRFANARFSAGSRFILEPGIQKTGSAHKQAPFFRLSRRSLMQGSILTAFSLLGLGSGATTAFAQQDARQSGTRAVHAHRDPDLVPLMVHTAFTRHQQTVRAVSWSPDAQMLASGGNDQLVLIWRPDGTVLHTLPVRAGVRGVAWSPDGRQLAVGAANALSFYDVQTGLLLAENSEHHTAPITALSWTNTSTAPPRVISVGVDKRAVVWNGQSHQPQMVFQQHTTAIEALAVLADTVATASQGGVVRIWDAGTGQEIHGYYMDAHHPLGAVAFSSTGTLATGSENGIISLWNHAQTCTRQVPDTFGLHCIDAPVRLPEPSYPIRALAFSSDGALLATGGDGKQLVIWSIPQATPFLSQPQQEGLEALSWSPSGQLLAGALGSRVLLWHLHR